MIELEEALDRILKLVPAPPTEILALAKADGRVTAERVLAPIDLPPFDNSAMDGYAVRAADVISAQPSAPVRLHLCGRVAAGETFSAGMTSGTCVRLFTGSPLPGGADAVVMQEDTQTALEKKTEVRVLEPVKPWENVRLRGEDVQRGAVLTEPGDSLTPARMSLLAATGLAQLRVGCRPVVGMLATGSELCEPGQTLAPGRIYESNRVGLSALARRAGAIPKAFPLVEDTLAATRLALEHAFDQCDAVITSGGVSVGEMDFVKRAFEDIGGSLQFWKVAIKPGRPFVLGSCRGKLLFGLPGNPISALVTFLLLVRPALLRWQGARDVSLLGYPGVLAQPLANPGQRRHFLRVTVDGSGAVRSAGIQASHILSASAAANGLVDLPPKSSLAAGAKVKIIPWE